MQVARNWFAEFLDVQCSEFELLVEELSAGFTSNVENYYIDDFAAYFEECDD